MIYIAVYIVVVFPAVQLPTDDLICDIATIMKKCT